MSSQFINTRAEGNEFPVRPGYSPEETFKAYNKIQSVDGGKAGSKLTSIEQLKEYYSASLAPKHSHPDNLATDDHNKDNINDMDSVDWMELLVSCHHMHGYRLNGQPLAINSVPEDYYKFM
jgi:hypothetical protein